ncbi:hypothetical protein CkaCkLH20_02088 [Colletotrichum karsti]|uniref:Uncharacterized protein n=1 Tax=Colletotrichum karsti TaxID=1095194 RepID=A0A9P6ICU7_9PEZI|nr:uncharacterized protein CkaCkLH20_02088 [Colletotrichum karsti]KAF9880134.1 hypothetical protein CkaCkLH20_02088 [Colletotrichum karsti]
MRADYSALSVSTTTDEAVEDESIPARPPLWTRVKNLSPKTSFYFRLLVLNVAVAVLGVLATVVYERKRGLPPRPIVCYCGSSIAEAKTLKCKYDSLSVAWLPPHCRNDELTAEFEKAGPGENGTWAYYKDNKGKTPLSLEEVAALADLPHEQAYFYTTTGWHVAHCAFYWRKQYRMRAKGSMTESRYDKESHIEHCYSIFMSVDPRDSVKVAAPVWLGGDATVNDEIEDDGGHH